MTNNVSDLSTGCSHIIQHLRRWISNRRLAPYRRTQKGHS